MKKCISLILCTALVMLMWVVPVMAIEENDSLDIIIHYKSADPDVEIALFTVGQTIVYKDLGDGLTSTEYGWSQFDGPFESDDFGTVMSFTAGYKETDVSEVIVRPIDWSELSKIMIPINKVQDNKIEIWVTGKPGTSDCDISYSAPSGGAVAAPAGEAAPAAVNPATGDSGMIIIAMLALLFSAGGVAVLKKVKA